MKYPVPSQLHIRSTESDDLFWNICSCITEAFLADARPIGERVRIWQLYGLRQSRKRHRGRIQTKHNSGFCLQRILSLLLFSLIVAEKALAQGGLRVWVCEVVTKGTAIPDFTTHGYLCTHETDDTHLGNGERFSRWDHAGAETIHPHHHMPDSEILSDAAEIVSPMSRVRRLTLNRLILQQAARFSVSAMNPSTILNLVPRLPQPQGHYRSFSPWNPRYLCFDIQVSCTVPDVPASCENIFPPFLPGLMPSRLELESAEAS